MVIVAMLKLDPFELVAQNMVQVAIYIISLKLSNIQNMTAKRSILILH